MATSTWALGKSGLVGNWPYLHEGRKSLGEKSLGEFRQSSLAQSKTPGASGGAVRHSAAYLSPGFTSLSSHGGCSVLGAGDLKRNLGLLICGRD